MTKGFSILATLLGGLAIQLTPLTPAHASSTEYFIAIDGLETLRSGTYNGLPNPNYNRLTFLYGHPDLERPASSHFHSIGAYTYTGPATSPSVQSTSSNNRLPEASSGQPPLPLQPGTGPHEGRFVSQAIPDLEYSNLSMQSIQALSGSAPGTPEAFLFSSSSGRWTSSLAGSEIALELVSRTDGLHIADAGGSSILHQAGDRHLLGAGNSLTFTPTFWTEASAAEGVYSATFRLHDVGTGGGRSPFGSSGTFSFDFAKPLSAGPAGGIMSSGLPSDVGTTIPEIPEPSSLMLLMIGVGALGTMVVRTRRASNALSERSVTL